MADDTRGPDEDATPTDPPTDPPTGENDVAGADWLISQLDAAPTGQFDTRQAPREPGGDSPVLAWWREKLVAADGLVNPEPRQDARDPDGTDSTAPDNATTDADAASTAEADAGAGRDVTAATVGDDVPPLPEPAQVEPRRASAVEPDGQAGPEPAFLPEPAFTPEPAWTPAPDSADSPTSFDHQPEAELEDEAETGLIPSFEPPIFTPRSARDFVADETADSPDGAVPGADDDEDSPVDDGHEPLPVPMFTPPAPESDIEPPKSADGPVEVAPAARGQELYETEDLDNFSWGLTANDQLDPRVHQPVTSRDAAAETPADAAVLPGEDSGAAPEEAQAKAATRRTPPDASADAVPALPVPVDGADPELSGPRRRTFTDMESPSVPPPSTEPADRPLRPARPATVRAPRPVILAAIGVVALLVLGGLFFLGSQLPSLFAGPAATPTPTPTAAQTTPTAPAAPVGPAAVGEQQWTALGGGECVDPYSTPWAETFTVVDCGAPHAAQMVYTAPVADDPAAEYPGEDEILAQINLWCSAPGVLDPEAASDYSDLQVQGTYPVSADQWAAGERNFYCFVNRSSGEPLSGSVAAAQG